MQDIKYHIITALGALVLAYTFAITANRVVRFALTPVEYTPLSSQQFGNGATGDKAVVDLESIYAGGFFKTADAELDSSAPAAVEQPTDLVLLGTITGPASIARAIIRKKSEPESKIYRLWEELYGYKLVGITNFKVYLRSGNNTVVLDMYAKENTGQPARPAQNTPAPSTGGRQALTLSRAEIQQKIMNNMDNMLRGMRAGPYRVDGKVEGFKLFQLAPTNMLYRLGARTGDVIKRINGHPIDSTEKLYRMWQTFPKESRVQVDIERGNQNITFDITISD